MVRRTAFFSVWRFCSCSARSLRAFGPISQKGRMEEGELRGMVGDGTLTSVIVPQERELQFGCGCEFVGEWCFPSWVVCFRREIEIGMSALLRHW